MYDCKLQHSFLLHVETGKSSNNCLSVVSASMKCLFCGHLNEKSVVEAEDCCEYCGMTWMVLEALQEAEESDGKASPLLSSSEAGSRIVTVEPPRPVASGCALRLVTFPEVTVPSKLTMVALPAALTGGLKRRMRFAALLARYATGGRLVESEYLLRAFRQAIFQLEDVKIPDALEVVEVAEGRRDGLVDLAESFMNYLHDQFEFIGP